MHYRFNTNPLRMLQEIRMRKAYALQESGCQVTQAAFNRFFRETLKSVFGRQR